MSKPSLLAGWRRAPIEGGVILVAREAGAGFIRVRTRDPLRPLDAVIAGFVHLGLGGAPLAARGAPRTLTTDEGEYAALFALEGSAGRRCVGVVFGDDALATIDGRVGVPERFELIEELVAQLTTSCALGLGGDRWRRFFYQPPPGWAGLARHRADVWLAPGYPRNHGTITVYHARPDLRSRSIEQHHQLFEQMTSEYVPLPSRPIETASGMAGKTFPFLWEGARRRQAASVVFGDGRYAYVMRLETDEEHQAANSDAFLALVKSVEALPKPRVEAGAFVHWSE